MAEKHKRGKDGILEDGVSHYAADAHDMQTFRDAKRDLSQFRTPVLIQASNPHERLYVAAFDGTGNDANSDPAHATNVAKIRDQIETFNRAGDHSIEVGYVAGPGTQTNPVERGRDGARGHTYDERLEEMYKLFIEQASKWRDEDPDVQIRLANIGFSRGAEQAAGFARLVHERGIQNPDGAIYTRNSQGQITHVEYTKPPLVPPSQVAQAVGLFDPVGTGEPVNEKDRRLPPSVITGFQLIAEDERRGLFRSSRIIDPGMTPDGRFLGVIVAGAHSDIGGSYHRDGLGIRNGNLMIDFINSLSDKPFLEKTHEPDDPRLNVVHRSEEGMLLYRAWDKDDRLKPEGYVERLVPRDQVDNVPDAYNAEPRDETLNRQFERRPVLIGPVPDSPPSAQQPRAQNQQQTDDQRHSPPPAPATMQVLPPPIPDHIRDFRHPEHPRHPGFQGFMDGLEKVQAGHLQGSRLPDNVRPEHFERIAAALTAAQGKEPFFGEVGRVHQDKDGALWVSNLPPNLISQQPRWLKVDLSDALVQTPEAQASRWREQHVPAPTAGTQAQAQSQSVDPQQLSPTDLRHPDHPRHGMFAQTRGLLATEYERWGLMRDPAQLDRETAQVVVEARKQHIHDVGGISLSFPQGSTRERPMVTLLEHPTHEFANRTSIDGNTLAQAPQVDQAGMQLQQVEQQVALLQRQEMQQQEREMVQGQARTV